MKGTSPEEVGVVAATEKARSSQYLCFGTYSKDVFIDLMLMLPNPVNKVAQDHRELKNKQ